MLYIDEICPSCEQGARGVYRCADGRTLVLMCDECQAVWRDLAHAGAEDMLLPDTNGNVPGTTCSLYGPQAGWATRAEAAAQGWDVRKLKEAPGR